VRACSRGNSSPAAQDFSNPHPVQIRPVGRADSLRPCVLPGVGVAQAADPSRKEGHPIPVKTLAATKACALRSSLHPPEVRENMRHRGRAWSSREREDAVVFPRPRCSRLSYL
jgi:hypothetical protein